MEAEGCVRGLVRPISFKMFHTDTKIVQELTFLGVGRPLSLGNVTSQE